MPGKLSPAEDRHHRLGQAGSVLIQHVLLDGSLDAKFAATLIKRQEVADKALDRNAPPHSPHDSKAAATAEASPSRVAQTGPPVARRREPAPRWHALSRRSVPLDRARAMNGLGFSKVDSAVGRKLAELDRLTPKQAALAALFCQRYKRERASQVVREATAPENRPPTLPGPDAGPTLGAA